MSRNIHALYFSATGTTEKVVTAMTQGVLAGLHTAASLKIVNFTCPDIREKARAFASGDVVIVGVPVIAGRVPNILLKYFNTLKGNGALAVAMVVYGNRNYDDALIELKDLLEQAGFIVIAAAAFVGEHAFSRTIAQGRPDRHDLLVVRQFARQIVQKVLADKQALSTRVKGFKPYRDYYRPLDKEGQPVDFRKIVPKTGASCTKCKICAHFCPMGSLDFDEPARLTGICIKCGACIKNCPSGAKYFDDENYLWHQQELEALFSARKEPELFI